jgi:hypothetical protein
LTATCPTCGKTVRVNRDGQLRAHQAPAPKRYKDNDEYFKMMRRLLRAASKRIELEDPTVLGQLMAIQQDLDAAVDAAAQSLHAGGFSWGEIGRQLGVTRQAAYQRWGK